MNSPNKKTRALPRMSSDFHRVGGGFSAQFSITSAGAFDVTWSPHVPSKRDLRRKVDMDKYRAARNAFLARMAEAMGEAVLVVETTGGGHE
ncbi:hypothetical protein VVD49_15680 [Uliginosibacterium sp. H3]|uniref:Uncharacterized protein n=1 Tax=Uliginosibacterium silvisoli TaxID=3114758 RepID=A0ABU6K7E1_9RHOO|nr:hypothetical protein [Uliginosibacterium sp. H3]